MTKKMSNIGSSILEKKSYNILPPNEQKKFEQFQKKRKETKAEEEETELTSPMPAEPEPSSDKLVANRDQLYQEKNVLSNNHKTIEEKE